MLLVYTLKVTFLSFLSMLVYGPSGKSGADPGFFLGGGALVSCSTSTTINHIVFFFGRIPVVLENPRSSQGGGGAHPLHPPPRSAPGSVQAIIKSMGKNLVHRLQYQD